MYSKNTSTGPKALHHGWTGKFLHKIEQPYSNPELHGEKGGFSFFWAQAGMSKGGKSQGLGEP